MNQRISQETKDQIRERVLTDDDMALELLGDYETIDQMARMMLDRLSSYVDRGYTPDEYSKVRELIMTLGPMLRVRGDLARELRYLVRPPRSENDTEEHEEDHRRSNQKVTNSRLRAANFAKNRQHKNRVSKRHDDVSSESPNQNS